jgi:hypothetical protein
MLSNGPIHIDDLKPEDAQSLLEARLRRTQEALADVLIERRLDQERIATLTLEVEELREQVAALRRARRSTVPVEPEARPRSPVRSRPRR